eukprot:6185995-Pleurochrysis_carterae.AAC.3
MATRTLKYPRRTGRAVNVSYSHASAYSADVPGGLLPRACGGACRPGRLGVGRQTRRSSGKAKPESCIKCKRHYALKVEESELHTSCFSEQTPARHLLCPRLRQTVFD